MPFLKNINSELLLDLAGRAAELGFSSFVVDDGWFTDGYEVDPGKFPDGLEPIAERVHQLGMRFGLWFNIGTDYGETGEKQGNNTLDGGGRAKGGESARRCLASKHRDFVADKLVELAFRYQVDYFKLDFSTICSPYGLIPYGCHSTEHPYHRDGTDAVLEQYEGMRHIRSRVKEKIPGLIVDFSFEVFGAERPSIAALKFSELHHSSNMNTLRPHILDAFLIRRTIYSYCRHLPPERILASLICLQDTNDIEHLLSALIAAPLAAGDLRRISADGLGKIKMLTTAINHIIAYGPMTRLQTLHPLDKPLDRSQWDGYCRCNERGLGLIAIFANRLRPSHVEIKLELLPESVEKFRLSKIFSGEEHGVFTRQQLIEGEGIKLPGGGQCPCNAFLINPL